jgi:hypothetical protein
MCLLQHRDARVPKRRRHIGRVPETTVFIAGVITRVQGPIYFLTVRRSSAVIFATAS